MQYYAIKINVYKNYINYKLIVLWKTSITFMNIKPILMKIKMQVVSNLLSNFQLLMKSDLLWLKCLNYTLSKKKKQIGH